MKEFEELQMAYRTNMFAREGQPKTDTMALYRAVQDKEATDGDGKGLMHLAARYFDHEAIGYLASEGLRPRGDDNGNTPPLHEMARSPYLNNQTACIEREEEIYKTAKALIEAGANPKKKNDDGAVCYRDAGTKLMFSMLRALAEAGVRFDAVGGEGKNLLHSICDVYYHRKTVKGFPEAAYRTVKVLLESGSPDPEDPDVFGKAPLYYAQRSGAKEIAALLSGDESSVATAGMTLDQAILGKDMEAVRALVEAGADPNDPGDEKRTPLMRACEYPSLDIVKYLLSSGADPNYRLGETGESAPGFLIRYGYQNLNRGVAGGGADPKSLLKILRELIKGGMDPNIACDNNANTPLILLAEATHLDGLYYSMTEELLESGADPDRANNGGQTPLMVYAGVGKEQEWSIAELLIDNGADVNLRDAGSNTPLMYAASNYDHISGKKIAELIFGAGVADLQAVNNKSQTALDIAVARGNEPLVKLILSNM